MATISELANVHRVLVHVTFPDALPDMRRLGLRPATQLVVDADLDPREAETIVTTYRRDPVHLTLSDGTAVILRDRRRPERNVESGLSGITEAEWLRMQSSRVYLFPRGHRRARDLVAAWNARGQSQDVIFFDTHRLLSDVAERVEVATVNTAVIPRRGIALRGPETFVALADLPKGLLRSVQEVTVKGILPIPTTAAARMVVRHSSGGVTEVIES
jgi:hypothetical protein